MCTVCYDLFALPLGVIFRLWSVIVTLHCHLLYIFFLIILKNLSTQSFVCRLLEMCCFVLLVFVLSVSRESCASCLLPFWVTFIWAKTYKMTCAPIEDSDQPGHPPCLIRVFAVHMKKVGVLSYPFCVQQRLWSDWADAQADLSLHWAYMPFCRFCHALAHLYFVPDFNGLWSGSPLLY